MDDFQAVSTSEAYTIAQLRALVKSGRLRVPQFQRSFRWDAKDVLSLFDSIMRGYPFGSLLLWKREAPAENLRIGSLHVRAQERPDALWVVDGQQRVTSLVNAVDPEGAQDPRFALGYSLRRREVVNGRWLEDPLAIPLPDLFDFSRAFAWLTDNPAAADYAEHIQDVTSRLNRVTVPATVMEDTDEKTLREVFDRINSRGKRLNAAEIFNAIHGGPDEGATTSGIAVSVDAQTRFGVLDDKIVVQAILVRRHADITRDVHGEFSDSRRRVSDFPGESEAQAYEATEGALVEAARFLQVKCGIPHVVFLPFRFQLLVLTRFFALFTEPSDRNLELLSRWVWRTSVGADVLGISGSQTDLRDMAARVRQGKESESVQRLLAAADLQDDLHLPDLTVFRATRSDSKMIMAALWNLHPVDLRSNEPITIEELSEQLEGETTPRVVLADLVPPASLEAEEPVAATKMISVMDRRDALSLLDSSKDLASLLLDAEMIDLLQNNRFSEFARRREYALKEYLETFLRVRTAWGQDDTPPLSDFVFDDGAE
ncbi:DUF262 domain-containing protein [Actinobaculum sp. 352]|uniref:DUF262 domain-containing protein n=1 Tax=Actinobaculum sp. 352 TaxID=2490946 RepID=UPI000F7E5FC0|nr:DUF262 domain-containing protein [Actinobaculum sp. 352]RTE48946.1 DUF262 domain-containing protein [Actinobaculum sp. 352]